MHETQPRTLSGRELAWLILRTTYLPERPAIFRQGAVYVACEGEGFAPPSTTLVEGIVSRLFRQGYLERSLEQTHHRYAYGSLNTYWYRFARADRESIRPGYRPGERYHPALWRNYVPLTRPRVDVPGLNPTPVEEAGIPDAASFQWTDWSAAHDPNRARLTLRLGLERTDRLRRLAEAESLSLQALIREVLDDYLLRKDVKL